jgi:S-formylglutathione hydrolase FrmB
LGLGFLIFLGGLFLVVATSAVIFARRHHWWRWSGAFLSLLVALCFVAASINYHYAYLPNLGSLWGWRAADQADWAAVRQTVKKISKVSRVPGHGAVVEVSIPGTVSHFHGRPAAIYLPPAWFRRPHPPLPVVELLHGSPGSPRDWTRSAGADVTSDAYAAAHGGVAPILVSPDVNGSFMADSECTNGTAGNVETYLTVDVPRWVDTYLHPSRRARQWAVGGFSEGGTCAMDIALRHPSEFPTFLDFGGEEHISRHGGAQTLFLGTPLQRLQAVDSYDPVLLLEHFKKPGRLSAWFEVGTSDRGVTTDVERLYGRAVRLGMHAHLKLRLDGHHSFRVWKRSFVDALPWLCRRLMIGIPHRGATLVSRSGGSVSLALRGASAGVSPGRSTRAP